MRINELFETEQSVTELSYTHPGIKDHLIGLGYHPAGEGGDQTTWLAPDGSILKIFGTQLGQRGETADHKMFRKWKQFCETQKNPKFVPYLPKFFGVEKFTFDHPIDRNPKKQQEVVPHTYLQYRMEKLTPVDDLTGKILDNLGFAVKQNRYRAGFETFLTMRKISLKHPVAQDETLFELAYKLRQIALNNNYELDLHGDNFMMRGNQVVVVDPWVAS